MTLFNTVKCSSQDCYEYCADLRAPFRITGLYTGDAKKKKKKKILRTPQKIFHYARIFCIHAI